jgi:hypothetical protein
MVDYLNDLKCCKTAFKMDSFPSKLNKKVPKKIFSLFFYRQVRNKFPLDEVGIKYSERIVRKKIEKIFFTLAGNVASRATWCTPGVRSASSWPAHLLVGSTSTDTGAPSQSTRLPARVVDQGGGWERGGLQNLQP